MEVSIYCSGSITLENHTPVSGVNLYSGVVTGQVVLKTFQGCWKEIESVIESKRNQWTFKASLMKDFDDIKMEIAAHIHEKWSQYDQTKPLVNWAGTIVKNQFINKLRDIYAGTASPCNRCACNMGNDLCSIYGEQGNSCALYKDWYEGKRYKHEARMPLTMETRLNEVSERADNSFDLEPVMEEMHSRLKELLTPSEWEIYRRLYIEHKTKEETAQELGFKTSEKGRSIGYKRIRKVEKIALSKAREVLSKEGLDRKFV